MPVIARIQSFTNEDQWYEVEYLEYRKEWICNCPHFLHRKVICKHIKAVREGRLPRGTINYSEFGEEMQTKGIVG